MRLASCKWAEQLDASYIGRRTRKRLLGAAPRLPLFASPSLEPPALTVSSGAAMRPPPRTFRAGRRLLRPSTLVPALLLCGLVVMGLMPLHGGPAAGGGGDAGSGGAAGRRRVSQLATVADAVTGGAGVHGFVHKEGPADPRNWHPDHKTLPLGATGHVDGRAADRAGCRCGCPAAIAAGRQQRLLSALTLQHVLSGIVGAC